MNNVLFLDISNDQIDPELASKLKAYFGERTDFYYLLRTRTNLAGITLFNLSNEFDLATPDHNYDPVFIVDNRLEIEYHDSDNQTLISVIPHKDFRVPFDRLCQWLKVVWKDTAVDLTHRD